MDVSDETSLISQCCEGTRSKAGRLALCLEDSDTKAQPNDIFSPGHHCSLAMLP